MKDRHNYGPFVLNSVYWRDASSSILASLHARPRRMIAGEKDCGRTKKSVVRNAAGDLKSAKRGLLVYQLTFGRASFHGTRLPTALNNPLYQLQTTWGSRSLRQSPEAIDQRWHSPPTVFASPSSLSRLPIHARHRNRRPDAPSENDSKREMWLSVEWSGDAPRTALFTRFFEHDCMSSDDAGAGCGGEGGYHMRRKHGWFLNENRVLSRILPPRLPQSRCSLPIRTAE
jgi:hypothetical protein